MLGVQYLLPLILLLAWRGARFIAAIEHDLLHRQRTDYAPKTAWQDLLIIMTAFVPVLNWLALAALVWFVIVDGLEALWDWLQEPLFPGLEPCQDMTSMHLDTWG